MKGFFNRFVRPPQAARPAKGADDALRRQVSALYGLYSGLVGAEKVVLKAGKVDALELMRSDSLSERVLALQKLVYEDPTVDRLPTYEEIPAILEEIEDELADMMARRTVEEKIEKKIAEKMDQRHQEYIREIKAQVLKEEEPNVENPQTLKKYALLEKLEQKGLTKSVMELVRPASLAEIVGQERAIEALRAKLASPYPQHLIIYGPPGVGKTTAARLVLEEAKKLKFTPFAADAPFIEVDGTTLRWDPRDMTNPLLGSVHDPIYQGARKDLAETGIPEPKPGLVTDAHGGILFIDEIGEMDPMLQNKLLKVLEDKRVFFDSAYYDPSDPHVPKYVKKLFADGAPADFILIGATTRDPGDINPAIRSRCAEIFFEPLTPKHIEEIVYNAARRLKADMDGDIPRIISEYTIEGRKAINILADAYGRALHRAGGDTGKVVITTADVYQVVQSSRLTPYVSRKASATTEVGKVLGLGVAGYLGSVLEIEAVAFPAADKGKGSIRFNDTAGSMAKDSVFNAAAVVRKLTGQDMANYDLHVNIVGGGRIDGPSAGLAITAAIISAITGRPIRQDVAVTGEISIQGKVKAVGGVFEKAYGAKQAGATILIIPKENEHDIPRGHLGLDIRPVETAQAALEILLAKADQAIA
ncbi:peptidase S16, lon domain protein [Thermosinus carboxydivorans Nor1]|uniref:endopeptidase La n=1 Tax=Thermosinus carboxydivorans Nor1 TaxID=401526 RepID=A1HRJ9_9FIRM|nr:Lon family ATP-dependent protease [Thermosinus carboxydivorans]EAX47330.1 peptidase S16, lon domain protein [Thermosinus carboxydivorans Nor1]